jgi:hydroxymethylpyrimidine pyrophosphatase-like HAD family hydrolase
VLVKSPALIVPRNDRVPPNYLAAAHSNNRPATNRFGKKWHPTRFMRYCVLAVDYDGTIATDGVVSGSTIEALTKVRDSGRKLVLVTGRHLPDLKNIFSRLEVFHKVIAENGALTYDPATREEKLLCDAPHQQLLDLLTKRKVPFSAGRCILATWEPNHLCVVEAIKELGLDLQVIFNKGAVMVLPSGLNKASGLAAALTDLRMAVQNTVAVGDAENDHPFLAISACGVAVANALPTLKERADFVTTESNGAGVRELIDRLLADDLASLDFRIKRRALTVGTALTDEKADLRINPGRNSILVVGPSASGKSTAVSGIIEQLAEQKYQFCLVDPEGDYENFAGAISMGSAKERPDPDAVMKTLEIPAQNVAVNLLAIPVGERPGFLQTLLPRLSELRSQTGRPHWIILDETHHVLPPSWSPAATTFPIEFEGMIFITVHPDRVSSVALRSVDIVIATGDSAAESIAQFAKAIEIEPPAAEQISPESGQAMVWFRKQSPNLKFIKVHLAKGERRRHRRSYAEGELSAEQSFYFRGPESKLNLKAQNLMTFMQLAEGLDEQTWTYHLRRSDYSKWFREKIKDDKLAAAAEAIELDQNLPAAESRRRITEAIQQLYTLAA